MRNEYRITIRRMAGARASSAMHEHMGRGSRILMRPPAGQFTLNRSDFRRSALISGGIGVTPMLAMLKDYVAMGDQAPPLLWMQVIPCGEAYAFRKEIAALLDAAPRARRIIWYTNPAPGDVAGIDQVRSGRPTAKTSRMMSARNTPSTRSARRSISLARKPNFIFAVRGV